MRYKYNQQNESYLGKITHETDTFICRENSITTREEMLTISVVLNYKRHIRKVDTKSVYNLVERKLKSMYVSPCLSDETIKQLKPFILKDLKRSFRGLKELKNTDNRDFDEILLNVHNMLNRVCEDNQIVMIEHPEKDEIVLINLLQV